MKRRWFVLMLMAALFLAPVHAQAGLNLESFEAFKAQAGVYSECEQGDSGANVLYIKERMQELGYYRAGANLDNAFNDTMVQRVKLFQENNGLKVTGRMDSSTLIKLKSLNPIRGEYFEGYWTEPDVTLIVPHSSYGKWNKKSDDRFGFSIQTKNVSTSRKIVATEFLIYTEDVWGDEIIGKAHPYAYTVTTAFGPGEMKYTEYMDIPFRHDTYKVYIAINKVRYGDGEVVNVETPDYWNWTIEW